ncbi:MULTISPECIES: hypothetical protein [Spirosoma]|uniref:Uncharacterized protein n=1 Tax=Spirosoma liriopis TaxID=2937440 RepID=A0ABT0HRG9_9BACT|nr:MULTISPECIES: hypothetical protein [Spirosoma]MCK8494776.1 hypothetical protein [Spirosoma liriopis]UHG93774.1 hypothetical protein LQ777_24960 [Spirosoma oryzicola]
MENQDNLDLVPYAVPLLTAQDWVTNWIDPKGEDQSDSTPPTAMRAFLVRRAEIVELLNQLDTEFIRMYIGKKPIEEPTTGGKRTRPCLLLVSAAYRRDIDPDSGKDPDTVIDLIGHMDINDTNPADLSKPNYNVFDFTHVCPPQCDEESPLFIASDQPCDC